MTQKEMVLQVLKIDGCISTFDAFIDLGCTRLASRISELRLDDGYDIEHLACTKKNRFGKKTTFFVYYLAGHYIPSGYSAKQIAWAKRQLLEAS